MNKNTLHIKITLFLFILFPFFLDAQQSFEAQIFEGNQAFDKKKYDVAAEHYAAAEKLNPKGYKAQLNLGNALYKAGKFQEAAAIYQRAVASAKTVQDKSGAQYNLGNSLSKAGHDEEAMKQYREALKTDTQNDLALHNYQILLKKEKQKDQQNGNGQQPPQNQPQDKKGQGDPKAGDQPGKQPQSSGQNGNQPRGSGGHGTGGKNPRQDKDSEGEGQNQKAPAIPKSTRDRILNDLSEKEKQTARRILNKEAFSEPASNEKDW